MTDLARFANRFRLLVVLRILLLLGAGLEVVVALLLVTTPGALAELLGLPGTGDPLPLHVLAVTLLLLAGLAWEAVRDPRRYSGIVRTAVAAHLLFAAVVVFAGLRHPTASALWWLAGGNALLGLALAGTWWSVRA